jgi:hypothetical protein
MKIEPAYLMEAMIKRHSSCCYGGCKHALMLVLMMMMPSRQAGVDLLCLLSEGPP